MSADKEYGITEEDREKMGDLLQQNRKHRAERDSRTAPHGHLTGLDPALPCGCGPGVNNIMDTASRLDYKCPTCGATYTREEVDGA